jgi:hypothetical protein
MWWSPFERPVRQARRELVADEVVFDEGGEIGRGDAEVADGVGEDENVVAVISGTGLIASGDFDFLADTAGFGGNGFIQRLQVAAILLNVGGPIGTAGADKKVALVKFNRAGEGF